MFATQKDLRKKYDVIIIGSGLAGLLISRKLREQGLDVAVLEQRDQPGGHLFSVDFKQTQIEHRLRLVPHSDPVTTSLTDLEWFLGNKVEYSKHSCDIASFDGLKKAPFVGFGEKSPPYYDVLKNYLETDTVVFDQSPEQWINSYLESEKIFIKTEVTSLEVTDGKITSATINGAKKVSADRFIMTGNPKALLALVSDKNFSSRFFQKLHRQIGWTAIGINFLFEQPESDENGFPEKILFPGTRAENFPTIGTFHEAKTEENADQFVGQFLTFIEEQDGSNGEIAGAAVRRVRKQLKKYLPEIYAKIESDRVTVSDCSHASFELKLDKGNQIPGIENLHIAHRSISWPSVFPCEASSARQCAEFLADQVSPVTAETAAEV